MVPKLFKMWQFGPWKKNKWFNLWNSTNSNRKNVIFMRDKFENFKRIGVKIQIFGSQNKIWKIKLGHYRILRRLELNKYFEKIGKKVPIGNWTCDTFPLFFSFFLFLFFSLFSFFLLFSFSLFSRVHLPLTPWLTLVQLVLKFIFRWQFYPNY